MKIITTGSKVTGALRIIQINLRNNIDQSEQSLFRNIKNNFTQVLVPYFRYQYMPEMVI